MIKFKFENKLNTIEVLISRALIDSCISHDEFVAVINVLRKYHDNKEEMENLKTTIVFNLFLKQYYHIAKV